MHRDNWLRLTDEALLKQCREERHRTGGPGGQRRNKVETAVKLTHVPSGVGARADESRYRRENASRALRRLRKRIALDVREPFDPAAPTLPSELLTARSPSGGLRVSESNVTYPIVIAVALDALDAAAGSYAKAARTLGVTTSQLLRLFERDPEVARAVERVRAAAKG